MNIEVKNEKETETTKETTNQSEAGIENQIPETSDNQEFTDCPERKGLD